MVMCLLFEEINKISREILIKTKDIVQQLGYEWYMQIQTRYLLKRKMSPLADTTTETTSDYEQVIDMLSKETGLSISIDYNSSF